MATCGEFSCCFFSHCFAFFQLFFGSFSGEGVCFILFGFFFLLALLELLRSHEFLPISPVFAISQFFATIFHFPFSISRISFIYVFIYSLAAQLPMKLIIYKIASKCQHSTAERKTLPPSFFLPPHCSFIASTRTTPRPRLGQPVHWKRPSIWLELCYSSSQSCL